MAGSPGLIWVSPNVSKEAPNITHSNWDNLFKSIVFTYYLANEIVKQPIEQLVYCPYIGNSINAILGFEDNALRGRVKRYKPIGMTPRKVIFRHPAE